MAQTYLRSIEKKFMYKKRVLFFQVNLHTVLIWMVSTVKLRYIMSFLIFSKKEKNFVQMSVVFVLNHSHYSTVVL